MEIRDDGLHVVVGCNGPVGTELMRQLDQQGVAVRGVCRSGRATAPPGVEIVAADITDAAQARSLATDAEVVYCCVGVDYHRWLELWPPVLEGLLTAASGKKLVFADNLYAYGPVDRPMTEDMPLTGYGVKPALRARMTETLLGAHAEGRLQVALVKASDFYGPGATNAILGERVFYPALRGKAAQVIGDPDQPHSFTYVPDFAAALSRVARQQDTFGQIWHVPNVAAVSLREIITEIYRLTGHPPRLQVLPSLVLTVLGIFTPPLRELKEMKFLWDRAYVVDDTKFRQRFDLEPTPLERGLTATLDWYRAQG